MTSRTTKNPKDCEHLSDTPPNNSSQPGTMNPLFGIVCELIARAFFIGRMGHQAYWRFDGRLWKYIQTKLDKKLERQTFKIVFHLYGEVLITQLDDVLSKLKIANKNKNKKIKPTDFEDEIFKILKNPVIKTLYGKYDATLEPMELPRKDFLKLRDHLCKPENINYWLTEGRTIRNASLECISSLILLTKNRDLNRSSKHLNDILENHTINDVEIVSSLAESILLVVRAALGVTMFEVIIEKITCKKLGSANIVKSVYEKTTIKAPPPPGQGKTP